MAEKLLRRLSERPRKSDRLQFINSVPERAGGILRHPSFLPYTRDHVEEFQRRVTDGGYSESDRKFILGALDLAIVAYQDNERISLRERKQTVQFMGRDVPIPYIEHPLSVAMAMIGVPRRTKLHTAGPEGDKTIEIDVRQDAYRAEVVVAALLHDVFEDSRIRLPKGGVIEGAKAWTQLMEEYFNKERFMDLKRESLDSVLTMINAVTKYKNIPEGLLNAVKDSEVFHRVTSLMESHKSSDKSFEDIENEVARSLSDMHKIISTCFGIGGDTHFDEQSFQDFFGAKAIKCHDIEHNLEDARVSEDKLIRAHILATLARIYGLPVASRMAAHLIVSNQFDMFWGMGDRAENLKEGRETVRLYGHFEKIGHRPEFKVAGQPLQVDALQIPILTPDEIAASDGEKEADFRSVLQYRMTIKDRMINGELIKAKTVLDQIEHAYNQANEYNPVQISYVNDKDRKEKYVGYPIREQVQTEILDTKRRCYYLKVYRLGVGKNKKQIGRLAGIFRIQDDQPSAHEVLKLGSVVKATDVPETAYIRNNYDGDPASSMNIFSFAGSSYDIDN